MRPNKFNRTTGYATPRNLSRTSNEVRPSVSQIPRMANTLDRRRSPRDTTIEMDPILLENTPILCNKYVVGKNDGFTRTIPGKGNSPPIFINVIFVFLSLGICFENALTVEENLISFFRSLLKLLKIRIKLYVVFEDNNF